MLLDSSVWIQILLHLHRMFPSSFFVIKLCDKASEAEKTKCEVVSGTYCKHFHESCRCYFMCLTLFLKTLLEFTHYSGSTVV